ncbi:MAG: 1-acyl-sn-glycerol-3-phosphate acyltransferase [Chitinophagales bacterium]
MAESQQPIKNRLAYTIADPYEWPITKLSADKELFLKEVIEKTEASIFERMHNAQLLHDELKGILYKEKNRLTKQHWKSDKPEESIFWSEIKKKILETDKIENEEEKYKKDKKLMHKILKHYAHEIVANFDPKTHKITRKILPWVFSRLMNASPGNRLRFLWASRKTIYEKLKITGPIEQIRELSKKGTVIVVPTHFSNLDSPTIGFVLDSIGLPAFTYGAGINLFTVKFISKWMNDLGAYKLDRRKKNIPYLELLKSYSAVAIQRGAHSLFFPGGTRSRSGALEDKLKLGLLGTAIEAQRENLQKYTEESAKKVFIVPVVLNYHFVMEAESLVNQHLSIMGKEQFIYSKNNLSTSFKVIKLFFKFLTATPGMTVSFAEPMDVLGNEVDNDGNSINSVGQKVSIKDYFLLNEELNEDKQRESVYTRRLADKIAVKFHSSNTVLSSHLLAFAAFEIVKNQNKMLDIYELLRVPEDEISISKNDLKEAIEKLKLKLLELESDKKIKLSKQINDNTDSIIKHGLKNLGVYHSKLPLIKKDKHTITTQNIKLLYFYHNRLEGYKLDKLFA